MAKIDAVDVPKIIFPEAAAPSTPASGKVIIYAKSDGNMYQKDDAGTETGLAGGGAAALAAGTTGRLTAGDKSTASTTFVDVDATNAKVILTTGAHRIRVSVLATLFGSTTPQYVALDLDIDGARQGGTFGLLYAWISNTIVSNGSFVYVSDALSAASHTVKLQWRTTAGTGSMHASASAPLEMTVEEMPI